VVRAPNYHLVYVIARATLRHSSRRGLRTSRNAYNWISAQPTINATGPCVPVAVGVGANQMPDQCLTGVRTSTRTLISIPLNQRERFGFDLSERHA